MTNAYNRARKLIGKTDLLTLLGAASFLAIVLDLVGAA